MEKYQYLLLPYLEADPKEYIKIFKRNVPLNEILNCKDSKYTRFFTGEKRTSIPKVYDFFMINSELDVLETRLFELNETVDKFIILEATHTHRGVRKPLFFARNIERFSLFHDKIIHIVADFSDLYRYESETQTDQDFWDIESTGRTYLWDNFLEAIKGKITVSDEDLLIHGDLDEIPSGEIVSHIKYCKLKGDALPARFQLTFYMHNFHWILPHYLPFPTIFNKRHIENTFCRGCGVNTLISFLLFRRVIYYLMVVLILLILVVVYFNYTKVYLLQREG
jgi:hypothetical protein